MNTKDIGETRTTVISKGAEDEILAFLVEDEDPRYHDGELENIIERKLKCWFDTGN